MRLLAVHWHVDLTSCLCVCICALCHAVRQQSQRFPVVFSCTTIMNGRAWMEVGSRPHHTHTARTRTYLPHDSTKQHQWTNGQSKVHANHAQASAVWQSITTTKMRHSESLRKRAQTKYVTHKRTCAFSRAHRTKYARATESRAHLHARVCDRPLIPTLYLSALLCFPLCVCMLWCVFVVCLCVCVWCVSLLFVLQYVINSWLQRDSQLSKMSESFYCLKVRDTVQQQQQQQH